MVRSAHWRADGRGRLRSPWDGFLSELMNAVCDSDYFTTHLINASSPQKKWAGSPLQATSGWPVVGKGTRSWGLLHPSESWNSGPHCARRISVGSVRRARSTAGNVATRAVSRMAHVGEAIISASVALTW